MNIAKKYLKKIIVEELQFFMDNVKPRRLYKSDNGQWVIEAENGINDIQDYGFKLAPNDTVDAYFLKTTNNADGQHIEDYGIYFPTQSMAWEKSKTIQSTSTITVGKKRIKLVDLKANNRGRKVSLLSLKRGSPAPGKIIKIFEIPKEISEISATSYEEVDSKDLIKSMDASNIMAYALGAYYVVIGLGEELSFSEWADRIKKAYDITNPANEKVYNIVKLFGRKAKIIRTKNDEVIIKGKRV